MVVHRIRAGFGAGLFLAVGCVVAAPSAAAHTELVRMVPAAGSTLADVPEDIRLVFSEEVQSRFARVAVTAPGGQRVEAGRPQAAGGTLTQPLRASAAPGSYTVAYRVISADGHPVSGELAFAVTRAGTSPPGAPTGPGAAAGIRAAASVSGDPSSPSPASGGTGQHGHPSTEPVGGHLAHLLAPALMLVGAAGVGLSALWRRRRGPRSSG